MNCREALQFLLDHIDYAASNYYPQTQMVTAVLPKSVVDLCREVLEHEKAMLPKPPKHLTCKHEHTEPDTVPGWVHCLDCNYTLKESDMSKK